MLICQEGGVKCNGMQASQMIQIVKQPTFLQDMTRHFSKTSAIIN